MVNNLKIYNNFNLGRKDKGAIILIDDQGAKIEVLDASIEEID